jgi:hypothetical protein
VKDENEIEMITWKPSAKVKGRLVVENPIKTPEEITEFIAANTERWEDGLNEMTEEEIWEVVNNVYRNPNKKKLIIYWEN